jgi:type I restriction enzyme M protein
MPTDNSPAIVSRVWNYAHVLKNAGVGYGDYVERITYLLFLKLAPPSLKLRQAGPEVPELGLDHS